MRKRLRFAFLAGPLAVLAFLAFSASAFAGENRSNALDPQTANTPYLAWTGNQLRLAKCLGQQEMRNDLLLSAEQTAQLLTPGLILRAKFRIVDWSGLEPNATAAGYRNEPSREPVFLNDADGDTLSYLDKNGRLCFSVTVLSMKPGLVEIKGAARIDLAGFTPGFDILGKHDFVAIWLRSEAPVIREVRNSDFPDLDLGDPSGDGIFNPLFKNGLVEATVTGNFPFGQDFSGIDPDNVVHLPEDWAWLASKIAVDDYAPDGGVPGRAAWRWDIHDDQTTASDHAGDNACTPAAGEVDAVDNCFIVDDNGTPSNPADDVAGGEKGPFSHFYGYSSDYTVGPFDPVRDFDTFLGDNELNADDAPMPPLRVDFRIAAGGLGKFEKADKDDIYVRDQSLPDNSPHNLYAPFYEAYIPAAGPSVFNSNRSGVYGDFVSNNFPGFLNEGKYDYWDLAGAWTEDPTRGDDTVVCRDELGVPRPNIDGYDHVAVYSDEHGKAFVQYNPNAGFRFTADPNGRCPLTPGTLGTSDITAEGIYPDQQPLWDQLSKVSNEITKTVNSLARKTLSCIPKSTNEMFCVETILDIQGRPVVGAVVQFSRTPLGNIVADRAKLGSFDTTGQTNLGPGDEPNTIRVRTGANGQAGVLVIESLPGQCVDVKAENIGTRNPDVGVFTFALSTPASGTAGCGAAAGGGQTGGGPTGGSGGTSTGGPTGTTGGSATGGVASATVNASVVSLAGAPVPAAQSPAVKAKVVAISKVVSARLLVQKGNRFLQLRVKSNVAKAKVRIVVTGKNGKNRVVIRQVATNRLVIVPNLKLNKTVKSVRVSAVS
jgi:hypothetical protein